MLDDNTIELGVKVNVEEAKRVLGEDIPRSAKAGWERVQSEIGKSGLGGLSETGQERLSRTIERQKELGQLAKDQGFFTPKQVQEFQKNQRVIEQLTKRHFDEQRRQAREFVPELKKAEKAFHDLFTASQQLGKAGREQMKPQVDQAFKVYNDLHERVHGPSERERDLRKQFQDMADEAAMVDVQKPQEPEEKRRSFGVGRFLGQFGRGLVGISLLGGGGYLAASWLRRQVSEESQRGIEVADLYQRLGLGMGPEFRTLARELPTLRPEESTRFLAAYGGLAGANQLAVKAPEAVQLLRGLGFSPEQGASTFGQAQRLGIDQRQMATSMGEEIARAQMRGREGEMFDSLIRMSETVVERLGRVANVEELSAVLGRLGMSGLPGLQGEFGARFAGRFDEAFRSTDLFTMPDLKRPALLSMFSRMGVTSPAEMMRLQEQGLLGNPRLGRGIFGQIEQFGGINSMLGASLAQQFGISLDPKMYAAERNAFTDTSRANYMQTLKRLLGPERLKELPLESLPNALDLAKQFQEREQKGEFKSPEDEQKQFLAALGTHAGVMQTEIDLRKDLVRIAQEEAQIGEKLVWVYGQGLHYATRLIDVMPQVIDDFKTIGQTVREASDAFRYWLQKMGFVAPDATGSAPKTQSFDLRDKGQLQEFSEKLFKNRAPLPNLRPLITEASQKYGVPEDLISAVMARESRGGRLGGVAKDGGVGPMQVTPSTVGMTREQLLDPAMNIEAGTKHLKSLLDYFGGDREKAIAAYNAGVGGVNRAISAHGEGWRSHLPKGVNKAGVSYDTGAYVNDVMDMLTGGYRFRSLPESSRVGFSIDPLTIVVKNEHGEMMGTYQTQPRGREHPDSWGPTKSPTAFEG